MSTIMGGGIMAHKLPSDSPTIFMKRLDPGVIGDAFGAQSMTLLKPQVANNAHVAAIKPRIGLGKVNGLMTRPRSSTLIVNRAAKRRLMRLSERVKQYERQSNREKSITNPMTTETISTRSTTPSTCSSEIPAPIRPKDDSGKIVRPQPKKYHWQKEQEQQQQREDTIVSTKSEGAVTTSSKASGDAQNKKAHGGSKTDSKPAKAKKDKKKQNKRKQQQQQQQERPKTPVKQQTPQTTPIRTSSFVGRQRSVDNNNSNKGPECSKSCNSKEREEKEREGNDDVDEEQDESSEISQDDMDKLANKALIQQNLRRARLRVQEERQRALQEEKRKEEEAKRMREASRKVLINKFEEKEKMRRLIYAKNEILRRWNESTYSLVDQPPVAP